MRPDGAEVLAAAEGIDVRFGDRRVLHGVDAAVRAREIVAIVGPNGAGKSTLLRALLGLVTPAAGRVRRRPGLRLGYVPQRLGLDAILPLTAGRFLALGAPQDAAAIAAVLAEVGAARVAAVPIQGLSGGELQRVLLARALLRNPELLVLDEPAQGVDVVGQRSLFDLIRRIRDQRGCGVLMVSHDLHLVMAATDTVICLNGHVCCTGHPEDVSRHPTYLALFGQEVAEGYAVYAHHHDHAH